MLKIGDVSDNGQVRIIDEDRLCYLVESNSNGATGVRTIAKELLNEFVEYVSANPSANAKEARDYLSGKSRIDKYEYGYNSTLWHMAKMVLSSPTYSSKQKARTTSKDIGPLQQIFYGTPGSGKSFVIKRDYEMKLENGKWVDDEEKKKHVVRITFHPDTDYASFVGCYKPITYEVGDEKKIKYDFVPQAFTEAYVKAWNDRESNYYLILEEINRGNCAQIFGDLFQLLDRNEEGWSEYPINADSDLRKYLEEAVDENDESVLKNKGGIKDGKICLPPNLYIIASMNTSDQSLFPMDSAFKRRWSWEYVPIEYNNVKSGAFTITLGNKVYHWHDFLKIINARIKKVTSSEDKQIGNFFIKHSVDEKEFKDKVVFYLWSEVGKDNYQTNDAIFYCYKAGTQDIREFSFNELYPIGTKKLQEFMEILGVPTVDEADISDDSDEIVTDAEGNTKRVKSFYSINGEGRFIPKKLLFEVVSLFVKINPDLSTEQVIETWKPFKTFRNIVISKEEYDLKLNTTEDLNFKRRYDSLVIGDGGTIYIFNNTEPKLTQEFVNKVNSKNWGIHIEKIEEE